MFEELQHLRPKARAYDGECWVRAEVKMDGWRLGVCIENGVPVFFGRKPRDLDLHVFDCMDQFRGLPEDTIIDCELHIPGKNSTEVPRAIKDENMDLQCTPFAIYRWGHEYIEDWTRHDNLMSVQFGVNVTDYHPNSWSRADLLQKAEFLGVEGFVLKEFPNRNWYKLKVTHTIDAVVTAIHMGSGSGFMKAGSVEVLTECGKAGVVKLLDENDRVWLKDAAWYKGRTLELTYDGLSAKGRLKFARFIRWRDDK